MLNQCNFIGRLGKDPEIKFTPSGKAVCTVSIAVSEKRGGEEHTEWVSCVFWEKLAEIVGQYLKKGGLIFASGKMQTRSYEKDGQKRYMTEIVCRDMKMLGGKSDEPAPTGQPDAEGREPGSDDVPF